MGSLIKPTTWVLGIVLLLVGILGFVNDPVLGIFEVDQAHNIVHILSGILGIAAASMGTAKSKLFLIAFGLVYAVVAVLGFIDGGSILGIFSINQADNYLHTAIALVCLAIGLSGKKA